jgi:hypothetical protein
MQNSSIYISIRKSVYGYQETTTTQPNSVWKRMDYDPLFNSGESEIMGMMTFGIPAVCN